MVFFSSGFLLGFLRFSFGFLLVFKSNFGFLLVFFRFSFGFLLVFFWFSSGFPEVSNLRKPLETSGEAQGGADGVARKIITKDNGVPREPL